MYVAQRIPCTAGGAQKDCSGNAYIWVKQHTDVLLQRH